MALYWSTLLSGLLVSIIHLSLRTFWWGYLASAIIEIDDKDLNEVSFLSLHNICAEKVKKYHKTLKKWASGTKLGQLFVRWLIIFIILFILLLLFVCNIENGSAFLYL